MWQPAACLPGVQTTGHLGPRSQAACPCGSGSAAMYTLAMRQCNIAPCTTIVPLESSGTDGSTASGFTNKTVQMACWLEGPRSTVQTHPFIRHDRPNVHTPLPKTHYQGAACSSSGEAPPRAWAGGISPAVLPAEPSPASVPRPLAAAQPAASSRPPAAPALQACPARPGRRAQRWSCGHWHWCCPSQAA